MITFPKGPAAHSNPGLCGDCRHARTIESDRGSVFVLCELSRTDKHFKKYPRLPVLLCNGYEKKVVDQPV